MTQEKQNTGDDQAAGSPQPPDAQRHNASVWSVVARRLIIIPASLFLVVSFSYLLIEIMPGDPAFVIAGTGATEEEVAKIRSDLGLDRAFWDRYLAYFGSVARGDFGRSFFTDQDVLADILRFLPASLELMAMSLSLAALFGVTVGAIAGYFRKRMPDHIARVAITSLQAIPDFLVGLLLIFFVFFLWRLAPAPIGRLGLIDTYPPTVTHFLIIDLVIAGDWQGLWSTLHRSALPVLTLALGLAAYFARISRTTIGAAMESRQVQFARACGLSELRVLHYAFLEARTPIITYTAILVGVLIGGMSIIETMFAWQGLGQWGLKSIIALDVPAIQGFIIVTGLFTMAVYLALDLIVVSLDPRIRHG